MKYNNPEPLSIIIPSYKGLPLLKQTLPIFTKITVPKEIIVADPDPKTIKFINKNYPRVKTIHLKRNYGVAGNTNRAVEHAKGNTLLITQNDFFIHPPFIPKTLQHLKTHPTIGATGGTFLQPGYKTTRKHDSARIWKHGPAKWIIATVCVLIPIHIYQKVGGLDEHIKFGCEDIDLSYKIQQQGYKITPLPYYSGYHMGNATWKQFNIKGQLEIYMSRYYVIQKHYPKTTLKHYLKNTKKNIYNGLSWIKKYKNPNKLLLPTLLETLALLLQPYYKHRQP